MVLPSGHVCWEPGRWHASLSFTCVLGRGDSGCRVAALLQWGYWACCSRKIQAFSKRTELPVPLQTREPRRSWKVTFHRVPCGFLRGAGAPARDTLTPPSPPPQNDGTNPAPARGAISAEKTSPPPPMVCSPPPAMPPAQAPKRPAAPETLGAPAVGRPSRGVKATCPIWAGALQARFGSDSPLLAQR